MAVQQKTLFEAPAFHETAQFHGDNLEFENEWETTDKSHFSHPYFNPESEADQFLFLAPLAAIAAKKLAAIGAKIGAKMAFKGAKKLAFNAAKKLISKAPKVLNKVQKIQDQVETIQQFRGDRSPPPTRPPQRRLDRFLREGEMEAVALEAEFFGRNEFEGELANYTAAREIALTELLAHEAARSENEQEAEYLLRTALPITLRIWSRRTKMSPQVKQVLSRANTRLVQNFHRQGRDGRQLLLAVPTITRRAVSTLRSISDSGGQLTPELVDHLMATHTARVLSTPGVLGPAVVRNFAIRRATPIPVGQLLPLLQRQH